MFTIPGLLSKVLPWLIAVGLAGYIAWSLYHAGVVHQATEDQPAVTAGAVNSVAGSTASNMATGVAGLDAQRGSTEGGTQAKASEGTVNVLTAPASPLADPTAGAAFVAAIRGLRGDTTTAGPSIGH